MRGLDLQHVDSCLGVKAEDVDSDSEIEIVESLSKVNKIKRETATTSSSSGKKPHKTVPKKAVVGTKSKDAFSLMMKVAARSKKGAKEKQRK